MQVQQKCVTTAKSAKDYLSKNEIPQLFECLMTGLMYHRPVDYINYLQECLEKIKKQGVSAVHWDMFLESKKTPLPPIAPTPRENFRPEPLPEIGTFHLKIDVKSSIVIIQGGPGIGKAEICQRLSSQFPEFCHIDLGLNIRERAASEVKDLNSKWKHVAELINDGNLAPDDFVLEILIKELNKHTDKKNFLIDGYPRTLQERKDFERIIGINKLKFVILIDCEEEICQQFLLNKPHNNEWKDYSHMAISKRISNYKLNTLAVCKYFDEQGKLKIIDGGTETELAFRDVQHLLHNEIRGVSSPLPFVSTKDSQHDTQEKHMVDEIPELVGISTETARKEDLPQCTIILLLGGPGSGKTETAVHMCKKYSGWVHIDFNEILRKSVLQNNHPDSNIAQKPGNINQDSCFVESLEVNTEAVRNHLKSLSNEAVVIILEGFPKNQIELNHLNIEIGKVDFVILLDSEEDIMRQRLLERFNRFGSEEDNEINSEVRIQYFKENGLPLCRYYDERCQLNIISSDKDIAYIIDDFDGLTATLLKNANNSAMLNEENSFHETNEERDSKNEDEMDFTKHIISKMEDQINDDLTVNNNDENENDENNNNEVTEDNDENLKEDLDEVYNEEDIENAIADISQENADNGDENAEENVEEQVEKHSEEQVEEKVEEPIEEHSEEQVEENVEEPIDEHSEEQVEEKVEEPIEEHSEEQVEEKVEEPIDEHSEEQVEEKVEEPIEEHSEEQVEDSIVPVTSTLEGHKGVRTASQMELMNANIILLLGGPGSGKKSLGDHLVIKYAMSFIHVDQLISNEINSNSEHAEALNQCIESNFEDITPILILLRKSLVNSMNVSKNIIVAGFPKTFDQYRLFIDQVAHVSAVLYLDVDSKTMQNRLENESDPDFTTNVTDIIDNFNRNMSGFLEELNTMDIFNKINGNGNIEEVLAEASGIIDTFHFIQPDE